MEPIPDTGPGFSGFVADLVWHAYCYFPFEGTWDWLLLFILLAITVRAVHLPFLWKLVAVDMRAFATGSETPGQRLARHISRWGLSVWCILCPIGIYLWIWASPAGQTFVLGRVSCTEVGDGVTRVFVLSVLGLLLLWYVVSAFLVCSGLEGALKERNSAAGTLMAQPFSRRDLGSLYVGGGLYGARRIQKEESSGIHKDSLWGGSSFRAYEPCARGKRFFSLLRSSVPTGSCRP